MSIDKMTSLLSWILLCLLMMSLASSITLSKGYTLRVNYCHVGHHENVFDTKGRYVGEFL